VPYGMDRKGDPKQARPLPGKERNRRKGGGGKKAFPGRRVRPRFLALGGGKDGTRFEEEKKTFSKGGQQVKSPKEPGIGE